VVLAHLRRRWSLRGREGFGFLSMRRLFSTALEAKKRRRKEVTGVIKRWIGHSWCVRLVQPTGARGEVLGFVTGVFVAPQDRQHCGLASGHMQPNASGRWNRSQEPLCIVFTSDRMPRVTRPVSTLARPVTPSLWSVLFKWPLRSCGSGSNEDTWRASAKSRKCDRMWQFLEPNGSIFEGWL
jgi:hypothetical protein